MTNVLHRLWCPWNIFMAVFFMLTVSLGSPMAVAENGAINQELGQYIATTEIHGDSLSQVHGALSVNQAAGDGNAQNNSRAIALSQDGGVAIAYTFDNQAVDMNQADFPDVAVARITDNAFSGTSGLISVNQVSGVDNMQLNAFAMAMSINGELSDKSLAETHSNASVVVQGEFVPVITQRAVHIDSTAFVGASGIAQINQTTGMGNVTSNRFEMSVGHID